LEKSKLGSLYYAIYLNRKFYVIIDDPYFVFFRSIFKPSIEFKYFDGSLFDDDHGIDGINIEDLGQAQPRWKRFITFGQCGWIR